MSYTEKEYDYAIERGLKVLAFIHEKPSEISLEKSDIDPELRVRLGKFRDKTSTGRLVKFWTKADELPGLVALSLTKTIKTYPAIGWVRANHIADVDVLGELNELRKRNEELEKLIGSQREDRLVIEGLGGLDESIIVRIGDKNHIAANNLETSFGEIFQLLAPELLQPLLDNDVKDWLNTLLGKKLGLGWPDQPSLERHDFNTIKIQFIALALVDTTGGLWSLTQKGQTTLMQLRTVKSSNR